MRMSCNGCRILRKGCGDDCSLRTCLESTETHESEWIKIKSPHSQSNATLFLSKFYGRAGLLNLLNAGPAHLRPAIFRSLLYEACGRIINPIYGSVGLLCSSDWDRCQAAVDAVLDGSPIAQVPIDNNDAAASRPIIPLKGCDVPHPTQTRTTRFKRRRVSAVELEFTTTEQARFTVSGWTGNSLPEEIKRGPSHDSSVLSVETVEASLANRAVRYGGPNQERSWVGAFSGV